MMLFLYQSLSMINFSNSIFKDESKKIIEIQKIKKVIYLDFLLAQKDSIIIKKEKEKDFVYLQSSNSIHQRYNPYITYIVKEGKLYRLESLKKLTTYELPIESEFDIDYLGDVEIFKVYSDATKSQHLINIDFKSSNTILLKIKLLSD